jgi:hypothetical protein
MEDKKTVHKAAFDGRLHFHEILKYYMNDYRNLMLVEDYHKSITTLRSMLSLIRSRIADSDAESIKSELTSARKWVGNSKLSYFVADKINNIYDKIHVAAKELFLPSVEDEEGDWNMDQFFKESDL